jgi:hypothetical protein
MHGFLRGWDEPVLQVPGHQKIAGGSGGDESSVLGLTWQAAKDGEAEHGGNRGSHSLSLWSGRWQRTGSKWRWDLRERRRDRYLKHEDK